mmetsp:Transcript_134561/g.335772  ORF Transcript_134561/g.335772 Transcript_134561/m.335772 type:complete len:208 (+) Transcript_134561:487-1110(+)
MRIRFLTLQPRTRHAIHSVIHSATPFDHAPFCIHNVGSAHCDGSSAAEFRERSLHNQIRQKLCLGIAQKIACFMLLAAQGHGGQAAELGQGCRLLNDLLWLDRDAELRCLVNDCVLGDCEGKENLAVPMVIDHVLKNLGIGLDEDGLATLVVLCHLVEHGIRMQRQGWLPRNLVHLATCVESHQIPADSAPAPVPACRVRRGLRHCP